VEILSLKIILLDVHWVWINIRLVDNNYGWTTVCYGYFGLLCQLFSETTWSAFVLLLTWELCIVQRVWRFKATLTSTLRLLRSTMLVDCCICPTSDSGILIIIMTLMKMMNLYCWKC